MASLHRNSTIPLLAASADDLEQVHELRMDRTR